MTQQEFEAILSDTTKRIDGNLSWGDDGNRSPAQEFRTKIISDAAYPLFVVGRYDHRTCKLSYVLIHQSVGRIYALDLGANHHNPTCEHVGRKHKHSWSEEFRDKMAYVPDDITESWDRPVEVWRQFCDEARIEHRGKLDLPRYQEELLPWPL